MRISDFLELPTNEIDLYQAMTYDTTQEEDKAIANCVNHADALADALASMLEHEKEMAYSVWDCSVDGAATFEESSELARFKDSFADELAALEAYRSAK